MSENGQANANSGGEGNQGGNAGQFDAGAAWSGLMGTLSPDNKSFAEGSGIKDLESALSGYRSLKAAHSKLTTASPDRVLTLPDKPDDKDGWSKVWGKLGRPEKADGYKVPEGIDGEKIKPFLGKLHEMGAPAPMVEAAFGAMIEMSQAAEAEKIAAFNAASDNDMAALKKEWGQAFEQEIARGRRAAKEAGLEKTEIDMIERVLGTGKTMRMFAKLGQQFSEDALVGGGNGTKFASMTPEAAKAKISELQVDKEFMSRLTSNNLSTRQQANAEWERLHRFAYQE